MEIAMPSTNRIGQPIRLIGQSRNARWMNWQAENWTYPRQQISEFAEHGIERSRSTFAHWRNGVFPETETLMRLIDIYPELKRLFWPETQTPRAQVILKDLDALSETITALRSIL